MNFFKINLYKSEEVTDICLPIIYPPLVQNYLPFSIISTIATANMKNLNWIMHNFIQLFKYEHFNKIESYPVQHFMYTNQSCITCKEISAEIIQKENIDIISLIINCINHQQYVVIYLDEYDIPQMRFYHEKEILHSQFIFGYNLEKQTFKILNFSKRTHHMEIIDVDFSSIYNNFNSNKLELLYNKREDPLYNSSYFIKRKYQIYAISYCDCVQFIDLSININAMKEQIYQYLNSINSSIYTIYFTGTLTGTWGVNVYDEIVKLLLNNNYNISIACLLYDHKKFMQLRLYYFSNELAEEYKEVVKIAHLTKMLFIKYAIAPQNSSPAKLINLIKKLKALEIEILQKLFK